jgi:hypothetical protein
MPMREATGCDAKNALNPKSPALCQLCPKEEHSRFQLTAISEFFVLTYHPGHSAQFFEFRTGGNHVHIALTNIRARRAPDFLTV